MSEDLVKLSGDILVILAPLLTVLVGWLAMQLKKKIGSSVDNKHASMALQRGVMAANLVVSELQQTLVDAYKEASEDGKLTKEETKYIRARALNKMRSYVSVDELKRLFDLDDGKLATMLAGMVEAALSDRKAASELGKYYTEDSEE